MHDAIEAEAERNGVDLAAGELSAEMLSQFLLDGIEGMKSRLTDPDQQRKAVRGLVNRSNGRCNADTKLHRPFRTVKFTTLLGKRRNVCHLRETTLEAGAGRPVRVTVEPRLRQILAMETIRNYEDVSRNA